MSELNLTAPAPLPAQHQNLGRNLAIDLLVLLLAVLVISVVIPGLFLVIHLMQQGTSLTALQGMKPDEILKIIGVPGIVALLIAQNGLFVFVPMARTLWIRREPIAGLGWSLPNPLRDIGLGVGLGIVILISNVLIGLTFASFNMRQNQAAQYPLFAGDYLGQAAFFIGAAVLVPIGEEVLFRGYIFNILRRMWGEQPWGNAAVFGVSALIFSLAHAAAASQHVLALLVPAFVMGLLLSYGMYRTGSLVPGIIAHAMNNSLALTALLVCVNSPALCPNI